MLNKKVVRDAEENPKDAREGREGKEAQEGIQDAREFTDDNVELLEDDVEWATEDMFDYDDLHDLSDEELDEAIEDNFMEWQTFEEERNHRNNVRDFEGKFTEGKPTRGIPEAKQKPKIHYGRMGTLGSGFTPVLGEKTKQRNKTALYVVGQALIAVLIGLGILVGTLGVVDLVLQLIMTANPVVVTGAGFTLFEVVMVAVLFVIYTYTGRSEDNQSAGVLTAKVTRWLVIFFMVVVAMAFYLNGLMPFLIG